MYISCIVTNSFLTITILLQYNLDGYISLHYNFDGSNTDGLFTVDDSNLFWVPRKIFP